MPYLNISPGVRYVFYSSLLNENNSSLQALGKHASNILNSGANQLQTSENNDTETKMDQVIKLLQIALKQEQDVEINFIQQKIINNPAFSNYPLFLNKLKKSCSSRENFDYLNVISAINIALQGANNFKKNNDLEIQRIEQIIKNVQSQINLLKKESNLSENLIKEKLSNSYIRHGGSYQKQYSQISEGVKKTLAGQRTEKIQKILEKILNEYKYKFIELGNGNFFNITDQDILNILQTPLTTAILTECINENNIEQELQNLIEKEYNLPNLKNESKSAKIETSFRVKRDKQSDLFKGDKLTDTFITLLEEGEDEAIKTLDKYLLEGNSNSNKGKTFETLLKELNEISLDKPRARASKKGIISKKIRYQLNKPGVYNEIYNSLKKIKVKISRPEESEIIAAAQAAITFSEANVFVEGNQNLKNDFVITVNFPNNLLDNVFNFIEKDFQNQVKKQENLIREAELGSAKDATTSIEATTALYQILIKANEAKKIKQNIKALASKAQKDLNLLKESFYIQGSAKDLMTYDNDIGFVGGTLGSSWDVAVNNLLQMYEKGGISTIDKDWLLTAILNTSSSSLGHHLKAPIEKYLSFAAAMMMFGQGGSQMILAGQQLNNNISIINKPNIMNLYYLNSNYYPASLVLQIILNNLTQVYTSLISFMNKETQNKTGVKIINNSYYGMEPIEGKDKITRWTEHAATTQKNLRIEFTFLAGILDILRNLQSQMSKVIP